MSRLTTSYRHADVNRPAVHRNLKHVGYDHGRFRGKFTTSITSTAPTPLPSRLWLLAKPNCVFNHIVNSLRLVTIFSKHQTHHRDGKFVVAGRTSRIHFSLSVNSCERNRLGQCSASKSGRDGELIVQAAAYLLSLVRSRANLANLEGRTVRTK